MRGWNHPFQAPVVSIVLAAGLGLFALSDSATAASLEADFNRDGYDDLAVGVPGEERNGAVNVIYGSGKGLSAQGSQLWDWSIPGIETGSGNSNDFGAALATGDFDGDGYADLAIGVPGAHLPDNVGNISFAGAVNVIYGSAAGLTVAGNQLWHKDSPGIRGTAEEFERFASVLTAGDFDGDGRDDLAIGSPLETVGGPLQRGAGRVYVLYGTRNGLAADGNQVWHQNIKGIPGKVRGLDSFSRSLAAGDFNDDGKDDLAIGVPLDFVKSGKSSLLAGSVHVLYGTRKGLTAKGTQLWHQGVRGIAGTLEWGDTFGYALAVGDFDGDGKDDLAVGAPLDIVGAAGNNAGSLNVIYGSSGGLSAAGSQLWHQNSKGIAGKAELQDNFGASLAAGDFDGNGKDDLAVGVAGEDLRALTNAGAVNVLYGTRSGLSASGDQLWHQNKKGVKDGAELEDAFGLAVFAGDFDGDGKDDLAIGVPGEDLGAVENAGAVNLLYGTRRGLRASGDQIWHQDSPGIEDLAEEGDTFGLALPQNNPP